MTSFMMSVSNGNAFPDVTYTEDNYTMFDPVKDEIVQD